MRISKKFGSKVISWTMVSPGMRTKAAAVSWQQ